MLNGGCSSQTTVWPLAKSKLCNVFCVYEIQTIGPAVVCRSHAASLTRSVAKPLAASLGQGGRLSSGPRA